MVRRRQIIQRHNGLLELIMFHDRPVSEKRNLYIRNEPDSGRINVLVEQICQNFCNNRSAVTVNRA